MSRCASDSLIIASRSSSVNAGSPFCRLRMAATTTSSNRRAAVSMISMCPLWMGSKDPGYSTFATVAPLGRQFGGRTERGSELGRPRHERHNGTAVMLRSRDHPARSRARSAGWTRARRGPRRGGPSSAGQSSKAYGGSASTRSNGPRVPSSHRITSARTTVPPSSATVGQVGSRSRRSRSRSRSTNVHDAAPRESASMPSAPLPANRSATRGVDERAERVASALKIASRARSLVGRVSVPGGASSRRPRAVPATTRIDGAP